ncbi:suppressor of fused domain protein [Cellulomonas sp.]|uniref:suppressor of fused domain protein n=1 Tax=Cellulomonas sp. TaxID=40001 RepID=UPI003BA9420E
MATSDLLSVAAAETAAIERHLLGFFGAQAKISPQAPLSEGPLRSRAPFFTAYEVAPTPSRPLWTYVSAGSLSEAMTGETHNVEFVIASETQDPRMVQHLAENSHYHCGPSSQRLDLGHRLPIGEPWVPGATVDAVLVSLPFPYGEDLEYVEWNGRHTRVLWLMPITQSELDFARREGNERLEELFETYHVEFMDFSRPPVV